jgi:hypothetical protein
MKSLTPCIIMAGALAISMATWGCSAEMPGDGGGGSERSEGGAGDDGPESGGEPDSTATHAGNRGGSACRPQARSSAAIHIVLLVAWPASLVIEAGQGQMHLWTKADVAYKGNDFTGTARPCGSVIPALTKAPLVGGGQVEMTIPDAVWHAPTMPVFEVRGTTGGFDMRAALSMDSTASLVGLTMSDPLNDPWPARPSQLIAVDHDGDGRPGIRAIPRTNPPFSAPPIDLASALDPNGPRADELDLATRTVVQLAGTRDSCTSARGTAQVARVDAHVVGCHIRGGGTCTPAQAEFIDAAQPRFEVRSATFEMVQVQQNATCAIVRTALPAD